MNLLHTYYKFADVNDYPGQASDTPIYTPDGQLIANVPAGFAFDLSLEGSGMVADGRVVNYSASGSGCQNGTPGYQGHLYCYRVLDGTRYPWGQGHGVPVEPLRSIAVDHNYIPYGSVVHIQEFDGLQIPQMTDSRGRIIGGFTHNGLFRAEDSGGAIGANHIDIYAGPNVMYHWLDRQIPTSYPDGSPLHAQIVDPSLAPPTNFGGVATSGMSTEEVLLLLALVTMGAYAAWRWSKSKGYEVRLNPDDAWRTVPTHMIVPRKLRHASYRRMHP